MTEKERKKMVKELKEGIIPVIKARNLINNPDKNIEKQKVLRAKAIFLNFDYSTGEELGKLINELLAYSRAGTRPEHVRNLAHSIKKYIVEKQKKWNFIISKKKASN